MQRAVCAWKGVLRTELFGRKQDNKLLSGLCRRMRVYVFVCMSKSVCARRVRVRVRMGASLEIRLQSQSCKNILGE